MDFIKRTLGFVKEHLSSFILLFLSIIAIVAAIALPGITANIAESKNITAFAEINLLNLAIGYSSIINSTDTANGIKLTYAASSGGISYFAIVTFVLFVIGIALIILDLIFSGKNLKIYGLIALIFSCVTVFLVPLAGTPIVVEEGFKYSGSYAFRDFCLLFKFRVGVGCYFYCMFIIIAALMMFFKEIGRILKAKGFGKKTY